jgi:hypothetical protein
MVYTLKNLNRIATIGYLATDKMAAHRTGGMYRKEMTEQFHEAYVSTFHQWRKQYEKMQKKVDALIIGDIKGIKGWEDGQARKLVQTSTNILTASLQEDVSNYAMFSFEGDAFIINKKITRNLTKTIPQSYFKKATKIIE